MKKVLIVDNHSLAALGLSVALQQEPDLEVLPVADTPDGALQILRDEQPDVIIMEAALPEFNARHVLDQLKLAAPSVPILVYSCLNELQCAQRLLRAGARGYVMKKEPAAVVIEAIRRVLEGRLYVSEAVKDRLLIALADEESSVDRAPNEVLSHRELQVFEMSGKGMSASDIAERLELSVKTIESYRTRARQKLNLRNVGELVQHAVVWSNRSAVDGVCA